MYDLPDFAIKNTFLNLRHTHRTTKTEHFPLSIETFDDDRKERSSDKPIIFDGIFSKNIFEICRAKGLRQIPIRWRRDDREAPLPCCLSCDETSPCALSLRRKIIWDVRARASFFGRPSTLPERGYLALWAYLTPLGLPPERDLDFVSRKQHRRSPAEIFRNKCIISCYAQPQSERSH